MMICDLAATREVIAHQDEHFKGPLCRIKPTELDYQNIRWPSAAALLETYIHTFLLFSLLNTCATWLSLESLLWATVALQHGGSVEVDPPPCVELKNLF